MSEVEAAAEVVGGAFIGRAVEPVSDGQGGETIPGPGECLNCAAPLTGRYCTNCGQKVHLHRTLGGLTHDIMHGVLHLDGKFWHTLPMLFWRPGELTRRYVAGQRARFISPIAFYLFTVVAMFALVVSVGDIEDTTLTGVNTEPAATIEEQRERVSDLEQSLDDMADDDYPGASAARAGVEASLRSAQRQLEEMEGGPRVLAEGANGGRITTDIPSDADGLLGDIGKAFDKVEQNPKLFLYKVQTKAYKLSWLLIPLSLPFMWLLFPFSRRFRMFDHAVFVTYSISFMMLLVINVGLWTWLGAEGVGILFALFYAPFHLYRQLKGAYSLSRFSALWRTFALALFCWIVLGLFVGLMFTLGALS